MTTTIVFPDRSQWTMRTWLRYLSAKLHRKNVEVCGGKNDDRTLQSIIDGSSDTYKLEAGQFDCVPPLQLNGVHIQGVQPITQVRGKWGEGKVRRVPEMPDECEQERRIARGQYADPYDE